MAENKFRSLVAELAQLITQADPFEDRAPTDSRFRGKTAWKGYDEPPGLLLAPQQLADLNAREQAREFGEYRHDDGAYAVDDQPCAAREEYQKEAPRVRRTRGSVITIVGLALLGAAGAFGYREMFGGSVLPTPPPTITTSTEPHKVAPTASTNRGDASQVGADITGSIEKLVSREEQPVTIAPPKSAPRRSLPRVSVPAATGQAVANQAMPHVAGAADPRGPPPTIAIPLQRAGQPGAADVTAAASARMWLPSPSHLPKRTALRQYPLVLSAVVMRFRLRRNAAKAMLKPRSRRCKRNTPTSLAVANRSFAARISAQRAPTIGFSSVPLRRCRRRQDCAAD